MGAKGDSQRVGWRVIVTYALAVITCALGNLSQTGVNAMLPSIMMEFSVDVALAQWLATGYMLVIGITVPIATYLSNKVCVRTHLIIGIAAFIIGSLLDCFAPNFAIMLTGRICQAVSVGILLPLMQNIAVIQFPPGKRATAMGIGGIAMGFAPNIGPTVGGALEFAFGWRSFFVLLAVSSAMLFVLTVLLVRKGAPVQPDTHFAGVSFVLSTLGFGGLLLGLSMASSYGFASLYVWVPIVVGIVFVVLFLRRQKTSKHPLIRLEIFKSPAYVASLVVLALLFGSFMGVTLSIPLTVQNLQGGSSLDAGMVLLPATVVALVVNPLSGILADRFGTRPICIGFALFLAVGSVLWVFIDENTSMGTMMAYQAVRSIGVSGLIGPLQAWSLSKLDVRIIPDGSSMSVLLRQAAAALGTALCVFALAAFADAAAATGIAALPYQISFGISALLGVGCTVCVVWKVR